MSETERDREREAPDLINQICISFCSKRDATKNPTYVNRAARAAVGAFSSGGRKKMGKRKGRAAAGGNPGQSTPGAPRRRRRREEENGAGASSPTEERHMSLKALLRLRGVPGARAPGELIPTRRSSRRGGGIGVLGKKVEEVSVVVVVLDEFIFSRWCS